MPELRLRARPFEREAPSPAIRRLRRLRLSLTLLFTAAMAVGLAALALLVIHKDSQARLDSLRRGDGHGASPAPRGSSTTRTAAGCGSTACAKTT